jgi:hypothetical protein
MLPARDTPDPESEVATPAPSTLQPAIVNRQSAIGNPAQVPTLTYEAALWLGLGALALLLRAWHLDAAPLTNAEASNALNTLALTRGESVAVANPLFGALQSIVFGICGANDFSARLIAALTGTLLCLLPLAARHELGRGRALGFGALLAISPSLWFAARQSDGTMLAWVLAFWMWAAWRRGAARPAYVLAGLLLACGQDAVAPALVAAMVILAGTLSRRRASGTNRARITPVPRLIDLGLIALVFVLASTLFLWRPAGLGDAFNGIAAWWRALSTQGPFTLWRAIAGITVYEVLILLGAVIGIIALAVNGRLAQQDLEWLVWTGAGLLLLIVTQTRQVSQLVPVVVGCAALAAVTADELVRSLAWDGTWRADGTIAGLACVMVAYAYLSLSQYAGQGQSSWLLGTFVALIIVGGIGIVAGLTLGPIVALRGVGLAVGAGLLIYTLSAGYQLTQLRSANPAEPYVTEATTASMRLLASVIETASTRATSDPHSISLQVAEPAPPALTWALRDQNNVRVVPRAVEAASALTPAAAKPGGSQGYVGDGFDLTASASLGNASCRNQNGQLDCLALARWFTLRTLDNVTYSRWIFWLRQDTAEKVNGR